MRWRQGLLLVTLLALSAGTAWALYVFPSQLNVNELDTSFVGEAGGDQAGYAVATVGSLDGDIYAELAIGAPKADVDGMVDAGKVYLFFSTEEKGPSPWGTRYDLKNADVILTGEKAGDLFGSVISTGGDLNRDGMNELVVSAPKNSDYKSYGGKIYLVSGRKTGWSSGGIAGLASSSFVGGAGKGAVSGEVEQQAGIALCGPGDLTGDGVPDLLIGSQIYHSSDSQQFVGRVYLVAGKNGNWGSNVVLADTADASIVGDSANQNIGRALAGANLDGDTRRDIVIGAPGDVGASASRGQVGVIFGKSLVQSRGQKFKDVVGAVYVGENAMDEAGRALAVVQYGGVDATDAVAVAAPSYDPSGISNGGKVYLIRGKRTGWVKDNSLASADVSWTGEGNTDYAGYTLAQAGDFNFDGYDDLVVGAHYSDAYLTDAGKTYVLFVTASMTGAHRLAEAGMQIVGGELRSYSARSLAADLFLDGDLVPDLAIGAYLADKDSLNTDAGMVYLFRGAQFYDRDLDGFSPYEGDCCDDTSCSSLPASLYPGAEEVAYDGVDQDCDGEDLSDVDGDGFDAEVVGGSDCDDAQAIIYPGASELCNGQDEDCDQAIDEGVKVTYYLDGDGDGYGVASVFQASCTPPVGYVSNATDCNDSTGAVNPGQVDIPYDGIDQDCKDGDLVDADGDGHDAEEQGGDDCNDGEPTINPEAPEVAYDGIDQDCDGYDLQDVDEDGYSYLYDCDDEDPNIHPDAVEVPYDKVDQDCKDGDLVDVDGDGVPGDTLPPLDCDDTDESVYPSAYDTPGDGIDQNCDGRDAIDVDQDGFSPGYDCNDVDPYTYPGADEIPYDTFDQDCDGIDLVDVDADGYEGGLADTGEPNYDCDDNDPEVNPGQFDVLYDDIDQDCDDVADKDFDNDNYDGIEGGGRDCDDKNDLIYPGAAEIAGNAVDENCDGQANDQDDDGYSLPEDCDDEDPFAYPNAAEIFYDGQDQNCDGDVGNDQDEDGFDAEITGGTDCNDRNPEQNPQILEVPGDGIDNDCDGKVDPEGQDADEDGYTPQQGDCDDDNKLVSPVAVETVGDDIDNDCDGRVDEYVSRGEMSPGGCQLEDGSSSAGAGLPILLGLGLALRRRRRTSVSTARK